MKKIVLASSNKGKLKEIKHMFTEYEVVSCKDMGFTGEIEENGKTFYENALIKAKTVSDALNLPALADDSGICVESLGGAPGIYSARYSPEGTDRSNYELLLKNLEGVKNRKAKFVCCMVYYKPGGEIITATGETEGEVLYAPEGENGFGYDPVFYSNDLEKSLGVATEEEKNAISHRRRALEKLKELL